MSKRVPKHVYRRDDRVIIVEPQVVRRVGYPLGIAEGLKHVESHARDVAALLIKLGIKADGCFGDLYLSAGLPVLDEGINRALAYAWLKTQHFGGPERTIHTERLSELAGVECRVMGKRVVYTGRRVSGHTSYGYDGMDSDPPYLAEATAHVLLSLWPIALTDTLRSSSEEIEVQAAHVKPAPDPAAIEQTPWNP